MDAHIIPDGEGWRLLPPSPDVCQVCACDHTPDNPHNAQSLFYQYHFYFEHGRWPSWIDATAHCPEGTRTVWRQKLIERGVDFDGGKVNPNVERSTP